MTKRDIFLTVVFVLMVGLITVASHLNRSLSADPLLSSDPQTRQDEQKFDQILKSSGAIAAYQYFKVNFIATPPEQTHELGHYIGHQLFVNQGVDAVITCDFTQNWSCFHALISDIFNQFGKTPIKEMGRLCENRSSDIGRCLDAIGHGFLFVEGYTTQGVRQALKDCDLMDQGQNTCYDGIFKEYLDRERMPYRTETTPKRGPSQELLPCSQVDSKYQSNCYFELPYFWNTLLSTNYTRMGQLCQSLPEATRTGCFEGVGRAILASSYYDSGPNLSVNCAKMPSQAGEDACILRAVNILTATYGEKKYKTETEVYYIPAPRIELCQNLSPLAKDDCVSKIKDFKCQKLRECQ